MLPLSSHAGHGALPTCAQATSAASHLDTSLDAQQVLMPPACSLEDASCGADEGVCNGAGEATSTGEAAHARASVNAANAMLKSSSSFKRSPSISSPGGSLETDTTAFYNNRNNNRL